MKQIMRGFVMLVLLSFATPAIAQAISPAIPLMRLKISQPIAIQPTANLKGVEGKQMNDAIFTPKAIKLSFSEYSQRGSFKRVTSSGNIYYSDGDLFVLQSKNNRDWSITNFATIDGKLYAWESGSKQGRILKRYTNDTKQLLVYLLDVSLVKTSLYRSYREEPVNFLVTQQGDTKTIRFKRPSQGFAGITVQENPFWLRSLVLCECLSITPTTELSVSEVSRPIPLEQIPESIKVLPRDVKFEVSETTAEYYMKYF